MLTNRDKAIIRDLNRFRVMDRDSIAEIHFAGLKDPQRSANNVLLRLLREGLIQRSTAFFPYVYFSVDMKIKQNSAKINHWLAILNVYKQMRKYGVIESFEVEPKLGPKGTAEPDIRAIFRKTNFFIEVQRTQYTSKQMSAKLQRYAELHRLKPFPHILIVSDVSYEVCDDLPYKVFQSRSFDAFMKSLVPKSAEKSISLTGGKIKIVVN